MSVKEIFAKIEKYYPSLDFVYLTDVLNYLNEKYELSGLDIKPTYNVLDSLLVFKPDLDIVFAVFAYPLYKAGFIEFNEIKKKCGNSVWDIISGLNNIYSLNYSVNDRHSQVDVLRKMFLAMAKDMRVVIIALAQRVYLMEELENLKDYDKKLLLARETLDVFVPIASRLGIYRYKTILEDLAFKYTDPQSYKEIFDLLQKFGKNQKNQILLLQRRLSDFLKEKNFKTEVFGRVKSVYSVFSKLNRKGLNSVEGLYDIFAMRIVLDTGNEETEKDIEHLYNVLGVVHSEWEPISSRFKDYVAIPKPNGYRSLHTVVLGLLEKNPTQPVEIQIRSKLMHYQAEFGVASHWLYKSTAEKFSELSTEDNLFLKSQSDWIKSLNKINFYINGEYDVLREVELDLFKDRIFVLTPKGEVKDLPSGSTPIDFAYMVHTDLGNKCYMAKVDDKVVPLDYQLKNGDKVSILTRNDFTPKLEWLSVVKTKFAKNKIKAYFNILNRDYYLQRGRKLVNSQLERLGKPPLDQNFSVFKNFVGQELNFEEREQLVEEIGKGMQIASDILRKIFPEDRERGALKAKALAFNPALLTTDLSRMVMVAGEDYLPVSLKKCCDPKIKDHIVGYVTRGKNISVHRENCSLVKNLKKERFIQVSWKS